MKIGDLIKFKTPYADKQKHGVIIKKVHDPLACTNEVFKVLWNNGTIGNNVWDYDLEVLSESR